MVDLGGYVILLVEGKDGKVKLYGSPADRADLEVGDDILEVNGISLENATHAEVIQHIHKCIRTRSISLRVRRRSPGDTSGPDPNNIQEAYVIAVEQQAKERLAKLSALEKVQPVDVTNMPALERPSEIIGPEVNGIVETNQIYAHILNDKQRNNNINGLSATPNGDNSGIEPVIQATKVEPDSKLDLTSLGIQSTAIESSAIGDNRSLGSGSSVNGQIESESDVEVNITGKYKPSPGSQVVSEVALEKTVVPTDEAPPTDFSALDKPEITQGDNQPTMSAQDIEMDNFVPRELPVDCPPSFVAASGMKDPPPFFSYDNTDSDIHHKATLPKDQDNRNIKKRNQMDEQRVQPQTFPSAGNALYVNMVGRPQNDVRIPPQQQPQAVGGIPDGSVESAPEPSTVSLEKLFSTLNNLKSSMKGSQDAEDIRFLQNLFADHEFQQAVRVHNTMTDVHTQEVPVTPVIHNTQYLITEVKGILREVHVRESEELKQIFRNIDFEACVLAHDTIAAQDGWVPAADDEDDQLDRASQFTEEDSVKIVRIDKTAEPLGATVRREGDSVIIGRIVRGGAADKSGLLHEGDELLEINGYDMKGKSVDDVCDLMATLTGTLTFLLIPCREVKQPIKDSAIVHIRANFDYDPEDDMYIPCRELGLSFQKGDILHVINQDDANWWQAYREGEDDQTLAGLIPSKHFRQQREAMKHTLVDDKEPKKKGWFCARKKKKKKKVLYNANQSEEYDVEEILTYEEVALYQPRGNRKRPIVLIGPTNVGRQELRQRLIDANSQLFAAAIPHTSRSKKSGEEDGRDYYFISKQRFEQDILTGKFVENGEFEKNIYGTSLDSIRHVMNSGKICVLNLHPQALKILKHSDLKPYVIFVRPPSLDRLRNMKAQTGENLKDEELRDMIEKGREMEDTHGHYFDYVLINSDLGRAFSELYAEITRIQMEPTWVPVIWLS
ncbi:protein PALS1-like isoform X2 [Glandiceps talaboti]